MLDLIYCEPPPPYSKLTVSILPMKHFSEKNQVITTMTSKLRIFLLSSSVTYFTLYILVIISTMMLTSARLYHLVWAANLLLNEGISLYIILSWKSNAINHLIRLFACILFLYMIGLILLIIYYATSILSFYSADDSSYNDLPSDTELAFAVAFILTMFHAGINLFMTYYVRMKLLYILSSSDV
jgi:hypothetical protein